jgi:hypothetical protein
MVQFLQEVGMSVETHRNHFAQEDDDHLWIPVCASNGWPIISGDKGLEKVALNVKSVTDSAAKVFLLTDSNMKGVEWGAAIIAARRKMQRIVDENDGPFFVTIGMCHDIHVGQIRFVGSGKPKVRPAPMHALNSPVDDALSNDAADKPKENLPEIQPDLFE